MKPSSGHCLLFLKCESRLSRPAFGIPVDQATTDKVGNAFGARISEFFSSLGVQWGSATVGCVAVGLLVLFATQTTYGAPIVWSSSSGGNGHYYESISNPLNWEAANAAANAQVLLGKNGHLATVTSLAENSFLIANFPNPQFLGGFQPDGSNEPAGGWAWVTGEVWNYTNWASGEPNNSSGTEKYLEFFAGGPKWNDTSILALRTYIVEYDILTPEPSSLPLAALGAIGLVMVARRTRRTLSTAGLQQPSSELRIAGMKCGCKARQRPLVRQLRDLCQSRNLSRNS